MKRLSTWWVVFVFWLLEIRELLVKYKDLLAYEKKRGELSISRNKAKEIKYKSKKNKRGREILAYRITEKPIRFNRISYLQGRNLNRESLFI